MWEICIRLIFFLEKKQQNMLWLWKGERVGVLQQYLLAAFAFLLRQPPQLWAGVAAAV